MYYYFLHHIYILSIINYTEKNNVFLVVQVLIFNIFNISNSTFFLCTVNYMQNYEKSTDTKLYKHL